MIAKMAKKERRFSGWNVIGSLSTLFIVVTFHYYILCCQTGLTFLDLCYIIKIEAVEMAFLLGKLKGSNLRVLTNKPLPPRLELGLFYFPNWRKV